MKLLSKSIIAAAVTMALVGGFNQTASAEQNAKVQVTPVAPYQKEQGVIDFSRNNFQLPLTTGLQQINAKLQAIGLKIIVPASASDAFNQAITAQTQLISQGQIASGVVDQFNQSTYRALVITMPSGFDSVMANKSIYITGDIPAAQTPAQGGLVNVFAYMSGKASQAPSLAITTLQGLALTTAGGDVTDFDHQPNTVGDTLNPTDNQILQHDQSNVKSAPLFYNNINSSAGWWDDYYTNTTDASGKTVFNKNDDYFSDWKSNAVNWYPTTPQDAYFSINLPYGKNQTTHAFQISYIGYGQGYAPDVNQQFATAFPNRPVYFALPTVATYSPNSTDDWWSHYLSHTRQSSVLANHGFNASANVVHLDSGWDNPGLVTKDKNGHAVLRFPDAYPTDINHLQINDASTAYELHNGFQYTYAADISATKGGQAVSIQAADPDLPNLQYTFTNSTQGSFDSVYRNGQLQITFTAHCPADANQQIPTYCPAVFSAYRGLPTSGRMYTLTNPVVTASGSASLISDPAFWSNIPKDQWWDGSNVFYADFHQLQKCDASSSNNMACMSHNKMIEENFNKGYMTLDKQWGGDNGGTAPLNVKFEPASATNGGGHVALTESNLPLVQFGNDQTVARYLNTMQCNTQSATYSKENCAEATQFANWVKDDLSPLMSTTSKTPAGEFVGLLADADLQLSSTKSQINVLDLQAAYDHSQTPAVTCKSIDSPNDLCQVRPSTLPSYCMSSGKNICTFWAPNISEDHKDMQLLMAQLHYRTGAGIIARNRSASGRYMMCVKMPQQTGASFSSWMFGYESFLQGDQSWLHENGAKRNSEVDYMESSYFNPNLKGNQILPNESDFGSYGGMISNAGSASYRDYYNIDPQHQAQNKYVWMGYEYHTGQSITNQIAYQHSDTSQLANNNAINISQDAERNVDSVQNARSGNYVDIYVDPVGSCTTDGINDTNFDTIWNKHVAEGRHILGESQQGKALPHSIMGDSKGLGWLPYRYARWTVALWNPANLTTIGSNAPYIGWSGTPLGRYVDQDGTAQHQLEADISYLAMKPKSDPRDKIEYDTGSTYWSNVYDDTALHMQTQPAFSCANGKVFPLVASNNNPGNVIAQALQNSNGVNAFIPSYSAKPLVSAKVAGDTIDVCVPNDAMAKIGELKVQLKPTASAQPTQLDCYSNTSSAPVKATLDMHGVGPNAYPECKFAGA